MIRSTIQKAAVPIYENTYLRILHRLQLIPRRHPKETRQFIPRLLHTNRMPRIAMRHTLQAHMKLMPRCILPKGVQRVFRFQQMPLRIRASCICALRRPTPRGRTKIKKERMGHVHHCQSEAIPANETLRLRFPIYIAFFVPEYPPAAHTRDAVVCVG